MRVQLVDPPAYTPPYDYSLAAALTRAGVEVELSTSRPTYEAPTADGFTVHEDFYRRTMMRDRSTTVRRAARIAEHLPGMLRHRRQAAGRADLVHYQWLTLEALDAHLMAAGVPKVLTAHNVMRRGRGRLREQGLRTAVDKAQAIVVHTTGSADELVERYAVDRAKVRVIPHGAFDYLTRLPDEQPLPADLAAVEGPVILSFGILRPYKGVDVLLEAFEEIEGAELWIVGRPWMDPAPLHAAAARAGGTVRFVDRFVPETAVPAFFRRADVVALPYRSIDQSGVLYTALAFNKAIVASAIGGFREIADEHGAALLVPPEEPPALRDAIESLLADRGRRAVQEARAAAAAAGPYSWREIGQRTLALYEELLAP